MRHDARASGAFLRQLDESEVLTVEHTCIESHLGESSRHGSHGESHVALHLSSSHLGINHVVVHAVEAEQLGCHGSVERETATVAGSASQGVAVGHAIGCLQEEHVVDKTLSISAKPQAEGRWHGYLQMCVARHQHVLVLFALLYEFIEENLHGIDDFLQFVACEELQVYQHLVVARASGVYLLSHVAQLLCQHQFHLGVYVLYAVFNYELAFFGYGVDVLEFSKELWQLFLAEQSDAFEHGDVRHASQYVILGEIEVQFSVASYGEAFYLLVHFKVFFPKFLCHFLMLIYFMLLKFLLPGIVLLLIPLEGKCRCFNLRMKSLPGHWQSSLCLLRAASSPCL